MRSELDIRENHAGPRDISGRFVVHVLCTNGGFIVARDKRPFGTIRRLPSGRYQALYTTPARRRVSAPRTFTARIDAEGWLHQRRVEAEAGKWNPAAVVKPAKVTFGDYAATWLAGRHVAGRPIKVRTRGHYGAILDAHLLPVFGAKPLASITPADVRDWHVDQSAHHAVARLQPVAHDLHLRG
jgi:Phage integrase, N-terminal SAM-like domain